MPNRLESLNANTANGEGNPNAEAESVRNGSMGISSGWGRMVGNMSAMAIIAMLLVWQTREQMNQAREDRAMFRDALEKLEAKAEKRYERTEATHSKSMERMGQTIERAVTSLEKATEAMERKKQ